MICAIVDGDRLGVDTSGFISYLNGTEDTSPACRWIFDELIGKGRCEGVVAAGTLAGGRRHHIFGGAGRYPAAAAVGLGRG